MNTPSAFNNGTLLTTAVATYYTVPLGAVATITQASVINTDVSNRTVSIYAVPSGGTADSSNIRVKSKTLAPNEPWVPYSIIGKKMKAGTTIQAICDTGAVVNIDLSGTEVTA
jgi:hypothetical protein